MRSKIILITGFCVLFLSRVFIHAQEGAYVNDESFANKENLIKSTLARP